MKNVILIFSVRWHFLLKNVPPKYFPPFSPKIFIFSKKLLNEKILKTHFWLKRLYSFSSQDASFPSKETWALEMIFYRFLRKLQLFLKKLLNNKIFSISFVIKKVTLIFGVRWPLTVSQWPSGSVANKVRVNPYFYVPKYLFSYPLPALEIFMHNIFTCLTDNFFNLWALSLANSVLPMIWNNRQ